MDAVIFLLVVIVVALFVVAATGLRIVRPYESKGSSSSWGNTRRPSILGCASSCRS